MTLFAGILAEPAFLLIWIAWLIIINSASILFVERFEARVVLAAWLVNAVLMIALAEWNGYNRLLGLSHVVVWTPLLVFLWRRRRDLAGSSPVDLWLRIVGVTNLVSLVVDVSDVLRYVWGEVSP